MNMTCSLVNRSISRPHCGTLPAVKYRIMGLKRLIRQKGFSLIELLIVVAIILIIAAIAIPNLLRAKIAANETSAARSIREISNQEIAYQTAYQQTGYAPTIANLGPPAGMPACLPATVPDPVLGACLLDGTLSGSDGNGSVKSGYGFAAIGLNSTGAGQNGGTFQSFTAAGVPVTFNHGGTRDFCASEDGVVHGNLPVAGNTGGTAAAAVLGAGGAAVCSAAPFLALQ
jgi:type IV pilus assembly protein PilA